MEKPQKKVIALVVLGMVAAFAIGLAMQAAVMAAPSTPSNTSSSTQTEKSKLDQLKDIFLSKFEARLGVSEAQLDAALKGAIDDTAVIALRDGLATQDEVNSAKKVAQAGFKAFLDQGFSTSTDSQKIAAADNGFNPKDALISSAATTLGMTQDEIRAALSGGKSLSNLATEHNISVQTLKNVMLSNLKSAFDAAVKANKITQANADTLYADFSTHIDDMITMVPNSK